MSQESVEEIADQFADMAMALLCVDARSAARRPAGSLNQTAVPTGTSRRGEYDTKRRCFHQEHLEREPTSLPFA